MLAELRVRNFAVIEEAALELGPGLNVLSGETGAGKTLVMSALGLLFGMRASPDMIRPGARESVVEGLFELEGEKARALLAEPGGDSAPEAEARELLIRRTIAADGGRSRVTINDALGTVQALSRLGSSLVEVYGQHEAQSLLRSESHERLLDRFGQLDGQRQSYRELFDRARAARARVEELAARAAQRGELLELARFRLTELERAGLRPGEDEELLAERQVLANAARLGAAASEAEQTLYGGDGAASELIARAEARLAEAGAIDGRLQTLLGSLSAARAQVESVGMELRTYLNKIEADPARLDSVDARLQEIARLKRKYGGSIESALQALEQARAEVRNLEAAGEQRAQAEADLAAALEVLARSAQALSQGRRKASGELKRQMESELKALGMRSPRFEARLDLLTPSESVLACRDTALGPSGAERIEFYLAPNLGQPPMPLARLASGGELSRVMLALKRLEARRRGLPTMVFDEVDAGIGGEVATVVGRKLKELGRYHQVLCVTHLAQIAAFADRHFTVEKEESGRSTRSRVRRLSEAERAEEIARMLGGAASEKFRRAARELIARAQEG